MTKKNNYWVDGPVKDLYHNIAFGSYLYNKKLRKIVETKG